MNARTSWSAVREAYLTAASASWKVYIMVPGSKGEATAKRRSALRKEMTECSAAAAEAAAHDGVHGAGLGGDGAGEGGRVAATRAHAQDHRRHYGIESPCPSAPIYLRRPELDGKSIAGLKTPHLLASSRARSVLVEGGGWRWE
jgi:hypothetical protein